MADAGFFKGTSAEQDRRFADKEHRLLKSMKFPPEFDRKVDMRKVNLQVMRPWITKKVVELVGFEDEVVVEYAMGLLEDQSKPPDPKLMQINLTGFLESKTPAFMSALWSLLLEAQNSPAGVPASFVQEKKEELRQKQEADDRALAEARRRGEHDLRLDEIRQRERGDRRGGGGYRGGRGGERGGRGDPFRGPGGDSFRGRNRDSGWGNRGGGRGGDRDSQRRRSPSRSRSRSRSPSPRRRYRRSPSPEGRRRSPSPGRRRSPPRRTRRSPSPRGNRRSVTPPRGGKRRSITPRRRSPSPRGNRRGPSARRSPSPRGSRRSPSPRRNRRPSPSRTPSAMSRSRSRTRSPSPPRGSPRRRGDSKRRDNPKRREDPSPRHRDDSPPRRRGNRLSPTASRSPSPARKRRRSSSRSGSARGDEKRDSPGVSVQPLSIKGAASTGKKSRLEEGGEDDSESTSRVNTPTPGTLPSDTRAPHIVPVSLEPTTPSNAPNYDSSTDTEPEEAENRLPTAFSSFNSYHTVDTSPAVSERKLSSHSAPANQSGLMADAPGLRRSISADRLTMRPSNSPVPSPLNRTRSDGLGLTIARGPGNLDLPPSPFVSVDKSRTQHDDIAHVNHVLRRLNSRRAYPGQADTYNYTSTDTESDDHRRGLSTPPSPRTVSYTTKEKGKWKAIDPYSSPSLQYEELPSPGLLSASFHRFTFGPSEDTDDDRRYETVSEGISDAEDFDIPTSIPTTTTLPPLPAPTVSRSRSSSRSFPSPAPGNDIPPVPPLPPFALLGSRMRAASSPRLVSSSLARSVASDQRSLKTPTPTQSLTPLPASPSSASISSTTSLLSGIPPDGSTNRSRSSRNASPRLGNSSASEKRRQRSISESGGHSGAGSSSGGGSRGRFATLANALRKSPNPSPGRGIEHIKPEAPKSRSRPKYTIAFIGSAGCGKTTLIEKGSKLSNQKYKPHVALKSVRYNDLEMTCKYETREALIVVDKTRSAYPAYAVEFDSAPFIKALETGGKFWPETMPAIDGVVLCYNASREGNENGSFNHIMRLSAAFVELRYPIIWVACKSDWIRPAVGKDGQATSPRVLPEGIISPQTVYQQAASEQIGLIEVAKSNAYGKERMRNLLTWMYKAIARAQRERLSGEQSQEYHNHASPEVLDRKPAIHSKPAPIIVPSRSSLAAVPYTPAPASPALKSPTSPITLITPPTRARSMSDLLSQAARDQIAGASAAVLRKASANISSVNLPRPALETTESQVEGIKTPESQRRSQGDVDVGTPSGEHSTSVVVLKSKIEPDPFAFATLDTLIKRLLGGISPGPSPEFTAGFCLTFRKFASPRSVLLGMIRYLRTAEGDDKTRALPLLNCYLRLWIGDYPTDFGAPGAIAPLEKLIGIIGDELSEESGRELRARIDLLYDIVDEAKDWAKPTEGFTDDDSDTEGDTESRPNSTEIQPPSSSPLTVMVNTTTVVDPSSSDVLQPRSPETRQPSPIPPEPAVLSERELQELHRVSKQLLALPHDHIAQEVTLRDLDLFWAIKRRDWLRHAYTPRRDRDPAVHALDQISQRFERLSLMIASVILISDRQRDRCLAFEFFLRVALSTRGYNNFASLHSIVSALDKVYSGQDGPAIETHVHASDLSWNKWLSLRVLILKSNGGTYKTALKHTSMPLIPTMAIHTSDLVRVMSNQDYKEGDPTLIHWGKFQIIAKIVAQMTEFQDRLRATDDYNFIPRPAIATMLDDPKPMTEEMIIEKTFPTPSEPARAATWSARVLRKVLG